MSCMVRMDLGSNSLDATSLQLSADTAASLTSRQCVSQGISHLALGRFHLFVYANLRPVRGRAEYLSNSRAPGAARSWALEAMGRQVEQAGSCVIRIFQTAPGNHSAT